MSEQESLQSAGAPQPDVQEKYNALRAQQISRKWGERLDDFKLPCPLCNGDLQFQGAHPDHFFEFAEGEPGVVYPLDTLSLSFICNRCGYVAEFDSELFNPAYIAQLEGASSEEIEKLSIRDYRVLVSLKGDEKSKTLLDLATALAGEQKGEVVILDTAPSEVLSDQLEEKLQHYIPHTGDPAPVQLIRRSGADLGKELLRVSSEQECDLLMVDGHDWANLRPNVTDAINKVLETSICDVAIVYDRGGLQDVRRILLATSGGGNARAAAGVAIPLAKAFDAQLHLLYVASPNHPNWREEGQKAIIDTLRDVMTNGIHIERHVQTSPDFVETVIEESSNYDLLLMGASTPKLTEQNRKSSTAAKIARNSVATSIMVHAHQTVFESWFKRLLG
jgi:nucleotide-binding universal stress UspA family protein